MSIQTTTSKSEAGIDARVLTMDPWDPATLYVTLYEYGIYKTTDGAQSWGACAVDASGNLWVHALAVDPHRCETIYAATNANGLFKSPDGGQRWFPADEGVKERWIEFMAIDPQTPTTLYATSRRHGMYKSTDGGGHWKLAESIPKAVGPGLVAFAPSDPQVLYTATDHGVWKSTDAATSWSLAGQELEEYSIPSLAIHPLDPLTVLRADHAPRAVQDDGRRRELEGGQRRTVRKHRMASRIDPHQYEIRGRDRSVRSRDGLCVHESRLRAAQIDRRWDGWRPAGEGLGGHGIADIAIDPTNPMVLYVTRDEYGGVFKSTDGAKSWTPANEGLVPPSLPPDEAVPSESAESSGVV